MPALPEAQCLHLTLICLDKSNVIASPVFKTGAAIAQISKVCFDLNKHLHLTIGWFHLTIG